MSYKKKKPVTVSEYEDHKQLVRHWVFVLMDDMGQIMSFFILLSAAILILPFDSMNMPLDTIGVWYVYFILISIYGFIILVTRFFRLKRIITYCQVMKKGTLMRATLDDLWLYRRVWPGYAVFYVTYMQDGTLHKRSYRCECLRVDSTLLGIKNVRVDRSVRRYVIPEDTTVFIKTYKDKMIVVHNDCGFYDLAHCKRREEDRGRGAMRYIYGLTLGSYMDRESGDYW